MVAIQSPSGTENSPRGGSQVPSGAFVLNSHNRIEFLRRFIITRDDVYARQEKDGRYRKVEKLLTDAALTRHLSGNITLGCYNASLEGRVKYATIDLDNHEGKRITPTEIVQKQVKKCVLALNELGAPFALVESSPGCYHVNIYFNPPAKVEEAYDFIRWVARNAGIPDAEVFPKQRNLEAGDYGNLVRCDFGKHQRKQTWSHFVDTVFNEIEEVEIKTIDISGFKAWEQKKHPSSTSHPTPTQEHVPMTHPQSGGSIPPCLVSLLAENVQLVGTGGHYVRIAITSAFAEAGVGFEGLCRLFSKQDDYCAEETVKQVRSILKTDGYSFSCPTLRAKCPRFVEHRCGTCPRAKRFK